MTEDEAKTKWCCGAPAIVSQAMDYAAGNTGREPLKCTGSSCMAWRWETDFNDLVRDHPGKSKAEYRAMAEGYCGLAGAPHA